MKRKAKKIVLYMVLVCVCVLMIGPFIWLGISSILPNTNIYDFPYNISFDNISFLNYKEVFEFIDFGKYVVNTVIISGGSVLFNTILACFTAYPLAKLNFKGKKVVFSLIISAMIVPTTAGMVVNYLTINNMGLSNTYIGVILPTAVTIINIFNMRQAFLSVPDSIRESGKIEGASEFRIFVQLILPIVKPSIAVVILFQFVASWNDFLWPMIVLNDTEKYPLSAALTMLNGQFSYNFGWIAAGIVLAIIPTVIIFLLTQGMFVDGISGANKE